MLNNGSILKAGVRNIECFDLSKHITGSLKQNLNELNCSVQKGEFDYELGMIGTKCQENIKMIAYNISEVM